MVRVGGECHLASSHYEEVSHALRGPALYLMERTFDPVGMRMDAELVGRRASGTTRFIVPVDPLVSSPSKRSTASATRVVFSFQGTQSEIIEPTLPPGTSTTVR
jgi:hypothetical protein